MTHETPIDVLEASDASEVLRLRIQQPGMTVSFFGRTDSGLRGIPLWPGWEIQVDPKKPEEIKEGLVVIVCEHGTITVRVEEVVLYTPETAQFDVRILGSTFPLTITGHNGYVLRRNSVFNRTQMDFLREQSLRKRSGSP